MAELFIILNAGQATAVRGISRTIDDAHFALEPMMLADGLTYVLPVSVLADEMHSAKRSILAELIQREIAPEEWASID